MPGIEALLIFLVVGSAVWCDRVSESLKGVSKRKPLLLISFQWKDTLHQGHFLAIFFLNCHSEVLKGMYFFEVSSDAVVNNPAAIQEMQVWFQGQEGPLNMHACTFLKNLKFTGR